MTLKASVRQLVINALIVGLLRFMVLVEGLNALIPVDIPNAIN